MACLLKALCFLDTAGYMLTTAAFLILLCCDKCLIYVNYQKTIHSVSLVNQDNFQYWFLTVTRLYILLYYYGMFTKKNHCIVSQPGAVAQSEASSLGMQAAPSSIPTSGTFFRGDLVMKTFLQPFSLFR